MSGHFNGVSSREKRRPSIHGRAGRRDFTEEPEVWFHELFHKDGTPFDPAETALYKKLTSQP